MNRKHRETGVSNPFLSQRVLRVASRHGMIGASYQNAVNNQREREGHPAAGDFRAEALWNGAGEHVPGSNCLVRHRTTGKVYMVFYPHREGSVMRDMWTVDGEVVELDALKPYLPPVSKSNRQETEVQIAWRTIALESVMQVQMNGKTYMVTSN